MHILLLTDGITPFITGGMQRHSANLAKYFTLAGAKVSLVHCVSYESKLPSDDEVNRAVFGEETNSLFRIYSFKFPKRGKLPGHYIRNSYIYSRDVFKSLDFSDIDFVYAKGFTGWHFLEEKKKEKKLPPIGVKFHGYEMFQKNNTIKQKIDSFLLKGPTVWNNKNADYIFSYGGKITDLIVKNIKFPKEKILEFTSGINSDFVAKDIKKHNREFIKFVFVGRYETRKGINELNIALSKLIDSETFEFHFIGPIPDSVRINNPKIIYHGELKTKEKLKEVLDEMDVLVCPSHSEGMPNVILEGMARGLAILATDVGAVELIVDSNNGKIIPPLNQNSLEKAMMFFCKLSKEELVKLKTNSINKVQNKYKWEVLANKILETIVKKIKNE